MDWNQLFLKREDWQKNTFNKIKNELISTKENEFIRYDNSKENHLVTIYGKSQIGKTTLILNMIGLKEETISIVDKTLRGGITLGNSSTSTAIIYSKSDNNKYGCGISNSKDVINKKIEYYNEDEMVNKLKEVRKNVENNSIGKDNILYIYIPNNYFIQDSNVNDISIIDMPGVESRNHKEDIHVESLMNEYIPISSVCIIACRYNEIQSLETLYLPNNLDWKRQPHKFILLITYAYSDASTKQYFFSKNKYMQNTFYDYVTEEYTKEIHKILGENSNIEVYPIDVGQSFDMLKNELENKSDREELILTKNKILSNLRQSIINHKGEKLKSAINDLKLIVEDYGREEIKYIYNKIKDNKKIIKDNENIIEINKIIIPQLIESIDNNQTEINSLENKKIQLQNYDSQYSLFDDVSQWLKTESLSLIKEKGDNFYLKDKERKLFNFLYNRLESKIKEFSKNLSKILEDTDISLDTINLEKIIGEYIISQCEVLYPSKKGFFSKREKVSKEDIRLVCENIQKKAQILFQGKQAGCISLVDEKIKEITFDNKRLKRFLSNKENKINDLSKNNQNLKSVNNDLSKEKEIIKNKRSKDEQTLKKYVFFAKESFKAQRNDVVKQINENRSASEKLLLILFLGILDKDYNTIIGNLGDKYEE